MLPSTPGQSLLDRMVLAVERVRDRLRRASEALEAAKVPYAVAGGQRGCGVGGDGGCGGGAECAGCGYFVETS